MAKESKERLVDVVYSSRDQLGEDKLEKTLDDIDKLSKNDHGFMIYDRIMEYVRSNEGRCVFYACFL